LVSKIFDAIVIGLGGMGSAAVAHLAARGRRVLGLDQFAPPHDQGSSHGESRVIRQAYWEDPAYVPLLLRAYELWRELERDSGRCLLTITGGLMAGAPESAVVAGSLRSAKEYDLPHDSLDAGEIRRRFPQFSPEPDTVALYEKNAGVVYPEESVRAQLGVAARRGAHLHLSEKVLGWTATSDGVRVVTARGNYEAGQLVISAGPWAGDLFASLALPLRVERQVLFWLEPRGGIKSFLKGNFPVWLWQTRSGVYPYGLPALEGEAGGVKVALHHGGRNSICTADTVDRRISDQEIDEVRTCVASIIPTLDGPCLQTATCMYTNTPDGHFLIDRHPEFPQVWIVSPCSGHGFKFCPVVGEIVADLIERGETQHPIGLFRFARLKP
jgi:sarcosine oxidase